MSTTFSDHYVGQSMYYGNSSYLQAQAGYLTYYSHTGETAKQLGEKPSQFKRLYNHGFHELLEEFARLT